MPGTVISIPDDEDTKFLEADWTGVGKKYLTKDIPSHIVAARESKLAIPEEFQQLLPLKSAFVKELLACNLPSQSVAIEQNFPVDKIDVVLSSAAKLEYRHAAPLSDTLPETTSAAYR
jgi:hypothetical protein